MEYLSLSGCARSKLWPPC